MKHNREHEMPPGHAMESMHSVENTKKEYAKFTIVIVLIMLLSYLHSNRMGLNLMQFLESFMGVFFVVFSLFKFYNLREFAYGFQSYDIIAKKSLTYAYLYPFIQLLLGTVYLLGTTVVVDIFVVILSLISSIGVVQSLAKKSLVHCVCLGGVIRLPLSTISFAEDFGMAIMAMVMIIMR